MNQSFRLVGYVPGAPCPNTFTVRLHQSSSNPQRQASIYREKFESDNEFFKRAKAEALWLQDGWGEGGGISIECVYTPWRVQDVVANERGMVRWALSMPGLSDGARVYLAARLAELWALLPEGSAMTVPGAARYASELGV